MKEGGVIACDAPRHPFPEMSPEVRAGLLDAARRLDPLVLRWGRWSPASTRPLRPPTHARPPPSLLSALTLAAPGLASRVVSPDGRVQVDVSIDAQQRLVYRVQQARKAGVAGLAPRPATGRR